jgi:two-component system sensor histidine kinase HydH
MLAAIFISAVAATSDFWDDFGIPIPSLTNIGTMLSALLMAMACLRQRFLETNITLRTAGLSLTMAVVAVTGYVAVFHWFRGDHSVLMVATITVTLAMIGAFRLLNTQYRMRRERRDSLTTLGRFSVQMAHDLKNPLAALKGALQFLAEEVARGHTLEDQAQFLALVLQQTERIHRVVNDYQRLGSMQPRRSLVHVNDIIRDVLSLQAFAAPGITVQTALDESLPLCSLDPDLVGQAIENLVRNAVEAMVEGGVVTVQTGSLGRHARPSGVRVAVRDSGSGMDARHSDRAFDEFFTTKAQGSGLGLAFVRRVVKVHSGRVQINSRVGAGTLVTLQFPAK